MRLWPLMERDRLLARPFPSGAAAPIAPQAGTEHLSRRAHSACAERRSESIDSPVASSTPVCTRWMGWTRLLCSISRMPLRYSHKLGSSSQGRHEHFRRLWLHGSARNAVSSWSMAVTECMALLHCTEVHAMRLWPLIERDWLRALSICRCDATNRAEPLAFECDVNAAAGERVQPPDAMPWHYCRCRWLVCSLEGLEVALCPPAAAIRARLARLRAQNTASSARGRHDHFRPISAAQQRAQRRIEFANGCG